jgi:hypothetical protein
MSTVTPEPPDDLPGEETIPNEALMTPQEAENNNTVDLDNNE